LPFLNLLDEFNTGDRDSRMIEVLEAEHRSHSLFYIPVVLLNCIIQIAVRPRNEIVWERLLCL